VRGKTTWEGEFVQDVFDKPEALVVVVSENHIFYYRTLCTLRSHLAEVWFTDDHVSPKLYRFQSSLSDLKMLERTLEGENRSRSI
jgi:hypothetical protein